MTVQLFDYLVFAPESPWLTYRAYDKRLLSGGVYTFLAGHRDRAREHAGLGLCIGHPGGRDRDVVAWRDGFTGMRSDQMRRAAEDERGRAILKGIAEHAPPGTLLYVGSHPSDRTIGDCGLTPWSVGFRLVFDAMSSHTDLSILAASAQGLRKQGKQCWTEANDAARQTGDMPVWAAPQPWRRAEEGKPRTKMSNAPAGSVYWWRGPKLDGELAMGEVRYAVSCGLGLCLRLEQLDAAVRREIYRVVA